MAILLIFAVSCEDIDQYELPDANSALDLTPPEASFSAIQGEGLENDEWKDYTFANGSTSSTDYFWDFGDGNTSTEFEPINTYPGEGTYTISLTATDLLGVSNTSNLEIEIIEPEAPSAITPTILNGDFTEGQDDWKVSTFTGGTTSPFNSSSDGSNTNYDGSDNGSKTPGAKWTSSTSAGALLSSSTRFAYQALTVSPNTNYILEFEYAIKNDVADAPGGDRLICEILDGHFSDGADALASATAGPLASQTGSIAEGKGNFNGFIVQFTSNATGEVAIWLSGVTSEDAYIDNVKVYPAE